MFTIDLLKGRNIPEKTGPEKTIALLASITIPLIIAITMFGIYVSRRINITILRNELASYEMKIEDKELTDAVKMQRKFISEESNINSCMSEIGTAADFHSQVSPMLVELVNNMPDSMIMTSLEMKEDSVRKKVPSKDDPEKSKEISVPVKILYISLAGNNSLNNDKHVRDYMDRLRFSSLLGPQLEDVTVSQSIQRITDKEVPSYQIKCTFKPMI
jgi:hypothetical protein